MGNITVVNHALIQRDLSIVRDKNTPLPSFRAALHRIAVGLVYEATRNLLLEETSIETPLEPTTGYRVVNRVVFVPILRAGLSFLNAALSIVPEATVGFIGIRRDEQTLEPYEYHYHVPPAENEHTLAIILDPMIATGGSMVAALNRLSIDGYQHCAVVALIAAPEGIEKVHSYHPTVPIFLAALDRQLNDSGYILPGLGDAGDRFCATT